MRLRIALDGREREVFVEGEPPDVRVSVSGRILPVRVRLHEGRADVEVGDRTIALSFGGGLRIDGRSRRAEVHWLAEETVAEGTPTSVEVRPPMPGRVVDILVSVGEDVRAGAPLVVLEAMKMQNEIPAPVSGTVQEVRVREGDAVSTAEVLVRIVRGGAGKPS